MKYLDSSAFVKHYRNEESGSDIINKLFDDARAGKEQLVSSFIVIGEIISVFDKWTRQRYISSNECAELVKIFIREIKELTDAGILLLENVSTSTVINCLDLIIDRHLSLNDAMHLYTALTNREMVEVFFCSDENLLKAAKAEGLEVLNPETEEG